MNKKELLEIIHYDKIAINSCNNSFLNKIFNFNEIEKFLILLRHCEYYEINRNRSYMYFLFKYRLRKQSIKLGFSIPTNVFGPGLSIVHYGTIIVNKSAKIGKNCRLHACVNIGSSNGENQAPIIGDNVYIGPGVILFGDISIANNVTIAANATVNKSCFEENVVLAGTPAKIVKRNVPVWWQIQNLKLR